MTDDGAASPTGRPLCPCHGEPMDKAGGRGGGGPWSCAVKRRARQLERYHAAPDGANYARTRRSLRARIALKRAQVEELEASP